VHVDTMAKEGPDLVVLATLAAASADRWRLDAEPHRPGHEQIVLFIRS
jgi:hypothetical protein